MIRLPPISTRTDTLFPDPTRFRSGFDNHWDGRGAGQPVTSVLSPRRSSDRRPSFTDWDILAIRALYRGEMPPGLARGAALEQIGRAHVCTPVINVHIVCRTLLE